MKQICLPNWIARHRRRRLGTEALIVYFFVVAPIAILHPFQAVPLINQYLWTTAMVLQVYLPAWLLFREGRPLSVAGLHLRRWHSGIYHWLVACLIFLPPAIVGHHLWQSWMGNQIQTQEHTATHYQFSYSLRGEAPLSEDPEHIQIFAHLQRPELTIRWRDPVKALLQSDGILRVVAGAHWVQGSVEAANLKIDGGNYRGLSEIRIRVDAQNIHFRFWRDNKELPPSMVKIGPQNEPSSQPFLSRDWSWIFYIIVAQLLMVALPEEFFYRGYLLTRLDAIFPIRVFWGIPISWGNIITSLLFALTHFVIGWSPHRLAVFFPSLIFGILKQRTQSLLAPILFHASANVLIKLIEIWYF